MRLISVRVAVASVLLSAALSACVVVPASGNICVVARRGRHDAPRQRGAEQRARDCDFGGIEFHPSLLVHARVREHITEQRA